MPKIAKLSFDLPREKLKKLGIKALSDAELLALILKTGSKEKHVLELSHLILEEFGSLKNLSSITLDELTNFFGIGLAKACALLAAFEIGKRVYLNSSKKRKIKNIKDLLETIKEYGFSSSEVAGCLFLNKSFYLIGLKIFLEGDIDNIFLNPKLLLKYALKFEAKYMIIFHTHPSGNLLPSKADIEFTKNIIKLAKIFDIEVLDHIILFENNYTSVLKFLK